MKEYGRGCEKPVQQEEKLTNNGCYCFGRLQSQIEGKGKTKKMFKFARFKKNMEQEGKIVIGTILKKFVKRLQEDQRNIESNQCQHCQ